jgi:hypothetical protein
MPARLAERGCGEKKVEAENATRLFSLRFPAHQDPFLISAPNLSRNRIEQQGEFGIFSKESFFARLRPRTKALYNLSPENLSGMQSMLLDFARGIPSSNRST